MLESLARVRVRGARERRQVSDAGLLVLSLALQLTVGLLFGHLYDMRIFMATGYLAGTGQNPYMAQDLSTVFHNPYFRGMTSVGYPPPWPLLLGLVYRGAYTAMPNLLVYNLAIKIPVMAANIGLAYLVAGVLKGLGAGVAVARRAWAFLLLNPFLLFATSAWGQFDSVVALVALLALVLLQGRKWRGSAVLLALAVSLKPTALPLLPVAVMCLMWQSRRQALGYAAVFLLSALLFCVVPFALLGWSPAPILHGWNAQFSVGGGMSLLTFLELLTQSYALRGQWWLLGLAWIPALGLATCFLKPGPGGMVDLLKRGTGFVLLFFLTRAWLSEPNIVLILPLVLILTSIGELSGPALTAVWTLPLVFSLFNASLPQLLFPSFPGTMEAMLRLAEHFRTARLDARILVTIAWQVAGWWMVVTCFRRARAPRAGDRPATVGSILPAGELAAAGDPSRAGGDGRLAD